jgi:phenylacetate-CoA ligase
MLQPHSNVAGIVWPAVADAAGGNLLALQWQFERSERWPADALPRRQLCQLAVLLAHCAAHVPFWRDRLAQAGLPPSGALTWEAWRRLPVLTRAEAHAAGTTLHAVPMPAHHGKIAHAATSGSTGVPLVFLKTELAQFFWHGFVLREVLWHRWDPAGRLAVIRADAAHAAPWPHGVVQANWGPPVSRVFATGPAVMLDMQTPVPAQAEWLQRQDPDILLTWPSNLAALARHCRDAGIRLQRLRVVRTMAETVTPALRTLCREAWGAELVDAYSAAEVGYIALQCPAGPHYHVQGEGILVEVLDEAGAPCRPGETGRVVVTPLHNFAMPLLRYEIGDDAELGHVPENGVCACGRTLPTLARVVGRTRDRLVLPSGERRFAYNPSEAFVRVRTIQRYQIAQVAVGLLEIRMIASVKLTTAEEKLLDDALARSLGHCFALRFVYRDDFPRAPGEKFRDIVCEIAP